MYSLKALVETLGMFLCMIAFFLWEFPHCKPILAAPALDLKIKLPCGYWHDLVNNRGCAWRLHVYCSCEFTIIHVHWDAKFDIPRAVKHSLHITRLIDLKMKLSYDHLRQWNPILLLLQLRDMDTLSNHSGLSVVDLGSSDVMCRLIFHIK